MDLHPLAKNVIHSVSALHLRSHHLQPFKYLFIFYILKIFSSIHNTQGSPILLFNRFVFYFSLYRRVTNHFKPRAFINKSTAASSPVILCPCRYSIPPCLSPPPPSSPVPLSLPVSYCRLPPSLPSNHRRRQRLPPGPTDSRAF